MTDYAAAKASLALEARGLAVESTIQTLCPVCNGGQSGERKLSLTRTYNGAMYCCHRASCGFRGFVAFDGTGTPKDKPRSKPARKYEGVLYPVPRSQAIEFFNRYKGFRFQRYDGELYVPALDNDGTDALVFTCRGFSGELLGYVIRSPQKDIKTYRHRDNCDIYYHRFPWPERERTLIIVEDCISAICCMSHGFHAVALLGTHLSSQVRDAIKAQDFRHVIVALDPDAQDKALQIASDNGWICTLFPHDPKDYDDLGNHLRALL